jgi:nitrogen-specific signal transduction histidine kinase
MPRPKVTPGSNAAEFEAIAKLLSFNVLLLDGETNLKFASTDAYRMFGSTDAIALRRDWRDCYDRLNLPDLTGLDKNTKPFSHRTELHTPGTRRLLRMDIYPLRHDGCDCYLILLKDREVIGALEQQLMLASQHQLQHYLTSTLVHDLNAPINTMRITLELIERMPVSAVLGNSSDALAKWDRYKGILREELGKLKDQVADIPSTFGATRQTMPIAFDLRSVIKDVARFLKHETTSKQIRPEVLLPPDPLMIQCRPAELKLALLSLACGLVEANKRSGHFQIHTNTVEGFVEIVFRGDDTRLDPDALNRYEQLTFGSNGTDIGLLVARLIVEAHGGEIQIVMPGEERVTVIRVLLPLHLTQGK